MQSIPLVFNLQIPSGPWTSLEALKKEWRKVSWQWTAADIYGSTVLLENLQGTRKFIYITQCTALAIPVQATAL